MDKVVEQQDWREDCAPRRVLDLFTTKWTSMILHTLHARHNGAVRTGVLHRSLPAIWKKMLVQTLREMESSGLITRHVESTVPPAVEYRLTPLGARFVDLVELVYDWGVRTQTPLIFWGSAPPPGGALRNAGLRVGRSHEARQISRDVWFRRSA